MNIVDNYKFRENIIKKQFKEALGYELNLENPKSFNEKIQWLKLYYHNPLITKCADKFKVRDYIKEKIGEEYLIPLIGVWDKVEDIDFASLPEQFVLKVNWGSGMNIIVKDKSKLDIEDAKKKLKKWINPFSNHYYYSFEYSYKHIEPKIICEKFMKNKAFDNLTVYKIFCILSKPYMFQVILDDKTENEKINYYDLNWNKLELKQNFENFDYNLNKPEQLDKMIELAKELSKDFKYFVRVDLFEIENKIYFSEFTFYTDNGIAKFTPASWDNKLGELIELPKEKIIEYDFIDRETLLKQSYNLEFMAKDYQNLENKLNSREYTNYEVEKLKLNSNWWTLFGISNNKEYLRLTLFGIRISIKMNKEKVDKLAWFIPIKKWRDNFRNRFTI